MAHPYYPPSALIPNYVPNATPTLHVLVAFGSVVGAIVLTAHRLPGPQARSIDRFAAAWFALCGFLHVAFEGYYVLHRAEISGMNTLFAQLWKEYTLSDSRYLTRDVFTVCVESITVLFWGPLSLLTLAAVVRGHPARHVLQVVLCVAHLYGVTLYYLTNWLEGVSYSRPEFLYYWVYYVGLNAPWAVVPLWLLRDSYVEICRAFEALGERQKENKSI